MENRTKFKTGINKNCSGMIILIKLLEIKINVSKINYVINKNF